jgi:hypothetical protein
MSSHACVCHLLIVTLFKCFQEFVTLSFQFSRFEQQRAKQPKASAAPCCSSCNAVMAHTLADAAAALKQLRD